MTLEIDFAKSKMLVITREKPHFHGLIFLPCKVSRDGLVELADTIDKTLKEISFVKSSTTQIYQTQRSLGYTQDYAGKFGKISSREANPLSDNGKIFPIDKVRSEKRRGSNMYKKWQRRADIVRSEFYWDRHLFFSDEYCQLFCTDLVEFSTVPLYGEVGTFLQNRLSINNKKCGNINMLKQTENVNLNDQNLDRLPIQNFSSCQKWARDIAMRYLWIRSHESNKGDASRWLIQRVSSFALRMDQEDKLDLIHKSTVRRLRNVRVQDRSCWGIIMLLLAAEDRGLFTRSVRHRASKGASRLMCAKSPLSTCGLPNGAGEEQPERIAA